MPPGTGSQQDVLAAETKQGMLSHQERELGAVLSEVHRTWKRTRGAELRGRGGELPEGPGGGWEAVRRAAAGSA